MEKFAGKLQYGKGAGKPCSKMSCDELWDCIENFEPKKPYAPFGYNCRPAARDAAKVCCLEKPD